MPGRCIDICTIQSGSDPIPLKKYNKLSVNTLNIEFALKDCFFLTFTSNQSCGSGSGSGRIRIHLGPWIQRCKMRGKAEFNPRSFWGFFVGNYSFLSLKLKKLLI